jgi:cobalamin synthase
MPAFGRWCMTYLIASYKYARKGPGLAKIFTADRLKSRYFTISSIYFFLLYILLIIGGTVLRIYSVSGSFTALTACPLENFRIPLLSGLLLVPLITVFFTFLIGWFFTRRVKGVTGDIIGGASELIEVIFLLAGFLVMSYIS